MVHAYNRIFGAKKPVFDGRSNLYVREPLPIGTEVVDLEVRKQVQNDFFLTRTSAEVPCFHQVKSTVFRNEWILIIMNHFSTNTFNRL